MKKTNTFMRILCLALAMLMLFCVVSCEKKDDDNEEPTPPAKTVTVNAPAGYAVFKNDDIGFAYPEGWTKNDASVVTLLDETRGNNITVAYEAKTSEYENMTQAEAEEGIRQIAVAMGGTASNIVLKKETTQNGLSITKISYTLAIPTYALAIPSVATMNQVLIATNAGDRTYLITVTEVVADDDLLTTVLNTLVKAA